MFHDGILQKFHTSVCKRVNSKCWITVSNSSKCKILTPLVVFTTLNGGHSFVHRLEVEFDSKYRDSDENKISVYTKIIVSSNKGGLIDEIVVLVISMIESFDYVSILFRETGLHVLQGSVDGFLSMGTYRLLLRGNDV